MLGSILFLIYINDITLSSHFGKLTCFADDTIHLFSGRNWLETCMNAKGGIKQMKN